MPYFSVITPTYNRAHLIGDAIQSILIQTDPDFEHIVVDDGSTDATAEVVAAISDPRIRYLRQPNAGVSAARNTAVREARGEILVFLDSDDLAQPGRLQLSRQKLQAEPGAGLVYGMYFSTSAARQSRKLIGKCGEKLGLAQLMFGTAFHWSTAAVRRKWLDKVAGFDEMLIIGEEWDLTLRLALAGCLMTCIDKPLTTVRMQRTSLSRDLHRNESSSRRVLEKTFSSPLFPEHLKPRMSLAYAIQHVQTAAAAFLDGEGELGARYLARAVAEEHTIYGVNGRVLAKRLVNYTGGLSLGPVQEVLKLAATNLPGSKAQAAGLRRKIWGYYHADAAFQSWNRSRPRKVRKHALLAIWNAPGNLANRGLLAILLKSFRRTADRSRI